jgi:phage shock protein A
MSIMRRVRDITAATLNDMLEKTEDPVRMIDSYLAAQRDKIAQAEQLYRQCVRHAESMGRKFTEARELADRRGKQAELALKAGEEDLARLALQEKLASEETADRYKELYQEAQQTVRELEQQLRELRADYDEVLSKRQYYAAKMESIRLQQRMNERFGGAAHNTAAGAFRRWEEQISDLELETKALSDIRRMVTTTLYRAGTEVKDLLEVELKALKRKLEEEGIRP